MKKVFLIIFEIMLIGALLSVTVYYSINKIMSSFVSEKGEVIVPDLQGKNLTDSLEALSQSKLALLKEGSEFNQDVPAGIVIRQSPQPGMNVKEGKTVRVTVSQGGEIVYVPNLVGETIRSATISLRSVGLILGEVLKKPSVNYEESVVLEQDPVSGSTVGKEETVNIVVSSGKPSDGSFLMVNWVGKSAEEAKKWAVDNGFQVDVMPAKTNLANPGDVFEQLPKFDSKLSQDVKIVFYVANERSSLIQEDKKFTYTVPSTGNTSKRVRFILADDRGEKDIFNGVRKPGTVINIPLKVQGKATVKVFVNNVSTENIELK
ncbi:MAG: PASTA domain-containing protein [Endomicrobiaceae bacterium]|jgi:serine/threonine-protein kinase|nr:PASTA domain-containing protein [Endomicrobiaceae bacterium]MDD3729474.1 PASTA domain-containing protein [Endomicrobiaceae bacterium]